ncbi:MAG TPA: response regulator [Anaerolineae bacterium]|nr:response regulator [Anaerolineae bacterium]HIP71321.1 response regulator [Anaerolineae bacterium]
MANIIVVDDDPTNTELIKMLLEMEGYNVTACYDIDQAKVAATGHSDAFVIDCNLARGANGLDLLHDIRQGQTGASSDTIVIMTSGDYRREAEALRLGAQNFLLKPYQPNDLTDLLNQLLTQDGTIG